MITIACIITYCNGTCWGFNNYNKYISIITYVYNLYIISCIIFYIILSYHIVCHILYDDDDNGHDDDDNNDHHHETFENSAEILTNTICSYNYKWPAHWCSISLRMQHSLDTAL
jgi:uncharacterized membrane protein